MSRSVRQILNITPAIIRDRSLRVRAVRLGTANSIQDKKLGMLIGERFVVQGLTGRYKVDLRFMPLNKTKPAVKSKDALLWVSCDCEFFLYNCEYALTHVGVSSIIHSNGKRPVQTNPRLVPYLCKHAYRALNTSLTTYAKK